MTETCKHQRIQQNLTGSIECADCGMICAGGNWSMVGPPPKADTLLPEGPPDSSDVGGLGAKPPLGSAAQRITALLALSMDMLSQNMDSPVDQSPMPSTESLLANMNLPTFTGAALAGMMVSVRARVEPMDGAGYMALAGQLGSALGPRR